MGYEKRETGGQQEGLISSVCRKVGSVLIGACSTAVQNQEAVAYRKTSSEW